MGSRNGAPVISFEEGIYIGNFKVFSLFVIIKGVLKAEYLFCYHPLQIISFIRARAEERGWGVENRNTPSRLMPRKPDKHRPGHETQS